MAPQGLATIGLPCSSFVYMNSATSQRTLEEPFGREDLEYVRQANTLAARVCLLILLITVRQCYFLLEQPMSSKMGSYAYGTLYLGIDHVEKHGHKMKQRLEQ
ncbi:unnamed protein product, partial [Symbiodinium pilosum]